jgi:Tfp pilus assembly protein PilF
MLNNENLLNTVKSYIENRQFLSAKKIINGILKINKKNIEALYLDAIINRLTDKIDLAKKQFIKLKCYSECKDLNLIGGFF